MCRPLLEIVCLFINTEILLDIACLIGQSDAVVIIVTAVRTHLSRLVRKRFVHGRVRFGISYITFRTADWQGQGEAKQAEAAN